MYKKYNKGLLINYVNNEIHLKINKNQTLIFDVKNVSENIKNFIKKNIYKNIVVEIEPRWFFMKSEVRILRFFNIKDWNFFSFSLFCNAFYNYGGSKNLVNYIDLLLKEKKDILETNDNDIFKHFLSSNQSLFNKFSTKILDFFHDNCLNFNILTQFYEAVSEKQIKKFKDNFVNHILQYITKSDIPYSYQDIYDCLIALKLKLNSVSVKKLLFILKFYKMCFFKNSLYLNGNEVMKILSSLKITNNFFIKNLVENQNIKKINISHINSTVKYYLYNYFLYKYKIYQKINLILKQNIKNKIRRYQNNLNNIKEIIKSINIEKTSVYKFCKLHQGYTKNRIIFININTYKEKIATIKYIVALMKTKSKYFNITICTFSKSNKNLLKSEIKGKYNIIYLKNNKKPKQSSYYKLDDKSIIMYSDIIIIDCLLIDIKILQKLILYIPCNIYKIVFIGSLNLLKSSSFSFMIKDLLKLGVILID